MNIDIGHAQQDKLQTVSLSDFLKEIWILASCYPFEVSITDDSENGVF
ncbi:hypothetical protein SAMN04489757_1672 [Anaerocolumna aminovalerica]|uniref:Uncharacterized protein n=1 Tax=Anaerocolumna aminovalerica TaxID=1527 RepID=A0A1I5J5U1_9FIRM|nr:hypothetical protein SAMN04489757_1672 [Anaerocolumna aminovalerica]